MFALATDHPISVSVAQVDRPSLVPPTALVGHSLMVAALTPGTYRMVVTADANAFAFTVVVTPPSS